MIRNLWNRVHLYCMNHEEPIEMFAHDPAKGSVAKSLYGASLEMFYSCRMYYPENRKNGETLCRNHISINEYQNAVMHLSKDMEEASNAGEIAHLEGKKWKSKAGIEYTILNFSDERIDIGCMNRRAIRY